MVSLRHLDDNRPLTLTLWLPMVYKVLLYSCYTSAVCKVYAVCMLGVQKLCSLHTERVQDEYRMSTGWVQDAYTKGRERVDKTYSRGTTWVQTGIRCSGYSSFFVVYSLLEKMCRLPHKRITPFGLRLSLAVTRTS